MAVPGTLIQRVVDIGVSPVKYVFNCKPINGRTYVDSDGHVDFIRHLLGSSNITNPQSREHNLLRLLTTCDTRVWWGGGVGGGGGGGGSGGGEGGGGGGAGGAHPPQTFQSGGTA